MFQRLSVHRFRSCRDVELDDLGRMTVLVGRNGAGKTNILSAIDSAARFMCGQIPFTMLGSPVAVSVDFTLGHRIYRYELNAAPIGTSDAAIGVPRPAHEEKLSWKQSAENWRLLVYRTNETVTLFGRTEQIKMGPTATLPALLSLLAPHDDIVTHVMPIVSYFNGVRYYALSDTSVHSPHSNTFTPISTEQYEQWRTTFAATRDPGDAIDMKVLHMYFNQKDKFDELVELVGPHGLGLIESLDVVSFDRPSDDKKAGVGSTTERKSQFHFLFYTPCGANVGQRFGLPSLSFGTRRVLRILTSLVFDESSVMLLEHPEDGIHQGLLKKVFDILKNNSSPLQIIISSHSTDVFNTVSPQQIRLVTMNGGATNVRALTKMEIEAAKRFMCDEGPLADFIETIQEE